MQTENIHCTPVWSDWVRLTHWLIAAGVLFAFASAWAIGLGATDEAFWRDWHSISGQLVLIAVVGRLILAVILPGSTNWKALLPDRAMWQGAAQMLRFYLSFARFPLPNWFAHNPFWRLLYPLLWVLLLGTGFSGLWYNSASSLAGLFPHTWHNLLANAVWVWVLAHIASVFLHDLKGKGASISGMINGYRYFHVPTSHKVKTPDSAFKGSTPPVYVAVDSIKRHNP